MSSLSALRDEGLNEYQDDLVKHMVAEMAKEMDYSVMRKVMLSEGWLEVTVPYGRTSLYDLEMSQWLKENCQGGYYFYGRSFIFQDARDTSMFTLRWA